MKIGIVGAGAWGTALAATMRRAGHDCVLWAREPKLVEAIVQTGHNPFYLPEIDLEGVVATSDLAALVAVDAVLLVTPAQVLRGICGALRPLWRDDLPLVICAKGIEAERFALMSEVAAEELPKAPLAVLSGPTFAIEVARGLPTAITLASADAAWGARLVEMIGTPSFRPYLTDDVIGAEMGGAVKNVLAIACGIVAGRGLGDNGRASLITRSLAEMMRLAIAKGARAETCMGLSGLGDLILTASSQQSRNYSLGFALGEGQRLADILGTRRSVTEGVATAASVIGLARRLSVDMPICRAVNGVLHQGWDVQDTIQRLLARPFRGELGFVEAAPFL